MVVVVVTGEGVVASTVFCEGPKCRRLFDDDFKEKKNIFVF